VILADSGALRVRRARAHAAGDHSLCRRCPAVTGAAPQAVTALPSPVPGAHLDPVAELRQLAAEALAAYRADTANAILLRECRATLALLLPKDPGKADADLTGLLKALG
jgi:hypothetical protein